MMWMNQVTSASETDSHAASPPPEWPDAAACRRLGITNSLRLSQASVYRRRVQQHTLLQLIVCCTSN